MKNKKIVFWGALVAAIVIVGAVVARYIAIQNQADVRFVISADELPSATGEHVVRYVSSDGVLSENPDESVGTVELWLE